MRNEGSIMHWGMDMGWMWFSWIVGGLLVIGLLIWVLGGTRRRRGGDSYPLPEDSAEEVLRRRLVEGEIDEDEYDRALAKLRE